MRDYACTRKAGSVWRMPETGRRLPAAGCRMAGTTEILFRHARTSSGLWRLASGLRPLARGLG